MFVLNTAFHLITNLLLKMLVYKVRPASCKFRVAYQKKVCIPKEEKECIY